jgi:indole-3-glycerol phosphate synthase
LTEAQPTAVAWKVPQGVLAELTAAAGLRASALRAQERALEAMALDAPPAPPFGAALRRPDVAIIAEIKRQSPSKGVINDTIDAPTRGAEYASGGAAALSVLTEPSRFGGSLDDLRAVRLATTVPLLRKDFIVDRVQLFEACIAGASAVLLIARALEPSRFDALAHEARAIGLELLLEVRDERELERALLIPGAVVGINNRNLETLATDDAVSVRLLPLVPADRTAVYESGVHDRTGVERAAGLGADAVLVGSSLSASAGPRGAVAALTGVPRQSRGR